MSQVIFAKLIFYFSASNGLISCCFVTFFFTTMTLISSHSSFFKTLFVFNPRHFCYQE